MKKEGYYSSGSFAAKAHVTKKTLRYYDEHDFLKPSYVNENGARFYTDQDFQKMQQIQMLKSNILSWMASIARPNNDVDFFT